MKSTAMRQSACDGKDPILVDIQPAAPDIVINFGHHQALAIGIILIIAGGYEVFYSARSISAADDEAALVVIGCGILWGTVVRIT